MLDIFFRLGALCLTISYVCAPYAWHFLKFVRPMPDNCLNLRALRLTFYFLCARPTPDFFLLLHALCPMPVILSYLCAPYAWHVILNLRAHLTWCCTKTSQDLLQNFLRNLIEPDSAPKPLDFLPNLLLDLALHQSLPDLLQNFRNFFRNLVEPDPAPVPIHTGAIGKNDKYQ